MPFTSAWYLVSIALLFALVQQGACLKCYFCPGVDGPDAPENNIPGVIFTPACVNINPNNNLPTIDCRGDCVKGIVVKQGLTLVMRGCSKPSQCKDKTVECHHCSEDLCNSSSGTFPSITVISFLGLVLFKLYM